VGGGGNFKLIHLLDISHFPILATEMKFLYLALPSSVGAVTHTLPDYAVTGLRNLEMVPEIPSCHYMLLM